MLFKYQVKTTEGEIVNGEAEAPNKFSLATALKKKKYSVLLIKEVGTTAPIFSYVAKVFGGVTSHEKIIFIQSLGSMLQAGLSLVRALSVLERQTKNTSFKKIITDLGRSIGQGNTLHDSATHFPQVFSPLAIAMIKAGEESCKLTESLMVVADQLEKSYELGRKVRGALIYPAIILASMVLIGIAMLTYVVPVLTSTF